MSGYDGKQPEYPELQGRPENEDQKEGLVSLSLLMAIINWWKNRGR